MNNKTINYNQQSIEELSKFSYSDATVSCNCRPATGYVGVKSNLKSVNI